jgi:hypothetical protein
MNNATIHLHTLYIYTSLSMSYIHCTIYTIQNPTSI